MKPFRYLFLLNQEKYLRDLKLCMSVYHDAMAKKLEKQKKKTAKGILARLFGSRKKTVAYSSDDLTAIFGQMPVLIKFSEQLLEDLVKCLPDSIQNARKVGTTDAAFEALDEKETTDLCLRMSTVFIKYTPFMLFYCEVRDKVEKESPKLQPHEVSSEIARRWKALPADQSRAYSVLSATYAEQKKFQKDSPKVPPSRRSPPARFSAAARPPARG